MSFYDEWISKKNTVEEKVYIEHFLRASADSTEAFHKGAESEIGVAISVINSVPIDSYVNSIDRLAFKDEVMPNQVPQYSNFGNGIYRVTELLEFANDGMSFEELGYQLVKAKTTGASIKYGENHAKLALEADLVEIQAHPSNVKSTALGKYLLKFLPDERSSLIKRLLLRNYVLQMLIAESGKGPMKYRKVVSNLSATTAVRRRNNVKYLLEFALENTDSEKRLRNIDWQVETKEKKIF